MTGWWWKPLLFSAFLGAGAVIFIESPRPSPQQDSTGGHPGDLSEGPAHELKRAGAPSPSEEDEVLAGVAETQLLRLVLHNQDDEPVAGAKWRLIRVDLDREFLLQRRSYFSVYTGCGTVRGDADEEEAINLNPPPKRLPLGAWTFVAEGISGPGGEIEVELDASRVYAFAAFHPDQGSAVTSMFSAGEEPDGVYDSVLRLAGASIWRGRVVDEHGAPVADASLTFLTGRNLQRERPLDEWAFLPGSLPSTDANGEFEVYVHGPAHASGLEVSKPGFVSQTRWGQDDEPLQIVLALGHRLFGRVVDRSGRPVEGAALHAYSDRGDDQRETYTDAEGRFSFDDAKEGSWNAAVRSEPHTEIQRTPLRVGVPNEIVLEPAGQVRFEFFLDPSLGDLAPKSWSRETARSLYADVDLVALAPGPDVERYHRSKSLLKVVDPESREGAYVFGRLEEGRYRLKFQTKGMLAISDLDVRAGETVVLRSEELRARVRSVTIATTIPGQAKTRALRLGLALPIRFGDQIHYNGEELQGKELEPTPTGFQGTILVSAPDTVTLAAFAKTTYADDSLRCWRRARGEIEVRAGSGQVEVAMQPEQLELVRSSTAAVGSHDQYPECAELEREWD